MMSEQRSLFIIKPDGVQRGYMGQTIKKFEAKGFKLIALKFIWASEDLIRAHYADEADEVYFPLLIKHMTSGPLVPMVWGGPGVIQMGRQLLGSSVQADCPPGSVRATWALHIGRNILHGSDTAESAQKEIKLWFKSHELIVI